MGKVKQRLKAQPPNSEESIVEAEPIATESRPEPTSLNWLTLEVLLYSSVFILGLALRMWNLGGYPLAENEAQQSLMALQLYGGERLEGTASYSPLLVSFNTLIFLLIHSSDATARLITVLLGSALILLPITLRRQLGPPICLIAAALLAVSPAAIFLSRTLNSEIAVAVGALMLVCGLFNWTEDGQQHWLYLLASGLAILLTAGPMAFSILVVFTVIVLIRFANFKGLWATGLQRSTSGQDSSQAIEQANAQNSNDATNGELVVSAGIPANIRRAGVFLLIAIILLSTAATLNLSGLSVAANHLVDWLSRFSLQIRSDAGFNAVFLLTIYEPLLVIAGLIGLAYVILKPDVLRLTFAGWFIGALILDLVMTGRPNGNIILSLVPLAFLAAFALAELGTALQQEADWSNEGIILASGLVIMTFGYIGLTGWLIRPCAEGDNFCQFAWLQAVAAAILFAVIVGFFWYLNSAGTAVRGAAVTGIAIGLIAAFSIGWRLNYGPLMNLAYQPLAGVPASTELGALTETLASESSIRVGDQTLLDVALVGTTPALEWQLRDYGKRTHASSLNEASSAAAIITPTPNDQELGLGEAYIGQDFAINAIWSPVGLLPKELINWLIYREANQRPESDKVVLWLRLNTP